MWIARNVWLRNEVVLYSFGLLWIGLRGLDWKGKEWNGWMGRGGPLHDGAEAAGGSWRRGVLAWFLMVCWTSLLGRGRKRKRRRGVWKGMGFEMEERKERKGKERREKRLERRK